MSEEPAPDPVPVEDKPAAPLPPPVIDLTQHDIKPDMFEGIHVLDTDKFEKMDGAPNFRQLRGFPIFGTGQPTEAAMVTIINRAKEGAAKEAGESVKVFWFAMRQEPIVYVNGSPYAPRDPENR